MTSKLRPHDPARYLETDQDVAEFLDAVLEDGDPATIADSIGIVARARGMSEVAREIGVSRESLFQALGDESRSELGALTQALKSLGQRLRASAAA